MKALLASDNDLAIKSWQERYRPNTVVSNRDIPGVKVFKIHSPVKKFNPYFLVLLNPKALSIFRKVIFILRGSEEGAANLFLVSSLLSFDKVEYQNNSISHWRAFWKGIYFSIAKKLKVLLKVFVLIFFLFYRKLHWPRDSLLALTEGCTVQVRSQLYPVSEKFSMRVVHAEGENLLQKALFLFLEVLRSKKPRLLHARSFPAGFVAFFLKTLFDIDYILDPRGPWVEEQNLIGKKVNLILRKFFVLSFKKAVCWISVTKSMAKFLCRNYHAPLDKVKVIPCFVVAGRFVSFPFPSRPTLLHLGGFSYWQSRDEILSLFLKLRQHIPTLTLLILTYEDPIRLGELPEGVKVVQASFEEVPRYMKAHLGLLWRTPSFFASMVFPIKVGEYLASGIPVCVNPSCKEVLSFIKTYRVGFEATPERILEFFKKKEYYKMRKRALEVAKNILSWENKWAYEFEELYGRWR